MSFAPGWRGTNTIAREMEERFGPSRGTYGDRAKKLLNQLKNKTMSVKAKFTCIKAEPYTYDNGKTVAGKNITMNAVVRYGNDGTRHDENESWSQATPSGQLNIHISNPAAFEQFEEGKDYYITFEPVV